MKKHTVRDSGVMYTLDVLNDGKGMRVSRDFACNLSKEFFKISRSFFDKTKNYGCPDVPYAYRERQVSPYFLIAMSKFVDIVFAESPTRRGSERENSHGWIDYTVPYRNSTFLIETKHCYSSFKQKNNLGDRVSDPWKAVNDQIKNISNEECSLQLYGKTEIIRVSNIITIHYASSKTRKFNDISSEDLCERHKIIHEKLNPQPNFSSLLIMKEDMKGPYELSDSWEVYPAVSLFFNFAALT